MAEPRAISSSSPPELTPAKTVDKMGNTQLTAAIAYGNKAEVNKLIAALPDMDPMINQADTHPDCNNTPLMFAIKKGWEDTALALIKKGADNHTSVAGHTCLHYACMVGMEEVIKELVSRGANINAKNAYGALPLDYYCYSVNGIDYAPAKDSHIASQRSVLPDFFHLMHHDGWKVCTERLAIRKPSRKLLGYTGKPGFPKASDNFDKHRLHYYQIYWTEVLKAKTLDARPHDPIARQDKLDSIDDILNFYNIVNLWGKNCTATPVMTRVEPKEIKAPTAPDAPAPAALFSPKPTFVAALAHNKVQKYLNEFSSPEIKQSHALLKLTTLPPIFSLTYRCVHAFLNVRNYLIHKGNAERAQKLIENLCTVVFENDPTSIGDRALFMKISEKCRTPIEPLCMTLRQGVWFANQDTHSYLYIVAIMAEIISDIQAASLTRPKP